MLTRLDATLISNVLAGWLRTWAHPVTARPRRYRTVIAVDGKTLRGSRLASQPEQIRDNVQAVGVTITDDMADRIDDVRGDVIETDPTNVHSPLERPDNRPR